MIDCHAYTVSGQWVLRLGGDDCGDALIAMHTRSVVSGY